MRAHVEAVESGAYHGRRLFAESAAQRNLNTKKIS